MFYLLQRKYGGISLVKFLLLRRKNVILAFVLRFHGSILNSLWMLKISIFIYANVTWEDLRMI